MTAFLIADTFQGSLARLTGDEQKAVKTTAFDLQVNPKNPGMQFHRVDRARDSRFWSVRVNRDIRIIVHRSDDGLLLCYVDHHDRAYDWAERRKLEAHPTTGAAQFVEIRERVQEVVVPRYVAEPQPVAAPTPILGDRSDEELLGYGVPPEWLDDVKRADEDGLLALAEHLPAEAAEALLELATGGAPQVAAVPVEELESPFDHPDAQRRFRVMANAEELERALDFPWEKWTVFLHPAQREFVEREYSGPARISGSAGTGKTIVALHRAAWLARSHDDARVLLATFSDTLARALELRLRRLVGNEPRVAERIEVHSLPGLGLRLHRAMAGPVELVTPEGLRECIREAAAAVEGHGFILRFLLDEWEQVVDAWQLRSWEEYRDVARLGRKTRLPVSRREVLWRIFEGVQARLAERGVTTQAAVFTTLARLIEERGRPPFDFAVIDEAQDLGIPQLRFFGALGSDRPDALFFAGDLGQRIFQQPFSWLSLGVDIRGRSRALRVNYRTSHQIREQADRLLGAEITDADGNREDRRHTVSVFNGPPPLIQEFEDEDDEARAVGEWIAERVREGIQPQELGIFVRSAAQLPRARAAVEHAGLPARVLDDHLESAPGEACISTMHLAKGLEFRAVAVMACDDEVVPLQDRIEAVGDVADLQEIYDTERYLLYVACTRARDRLWVSGVEPASEFLEDMG